MSEKVNQSRLENKMSLNSKFCIKVRGYAVGSNMEVSEPEELLQKLLAKKRFLQQEIRQRSGALPNVYMGNRLAVILSSKRNAVRVDLAAGPGLMVNIFVN